MSIELFAPLSTTFIGNLVELHALNHLILFFSFHGHILQTSDWYYYYYENYSK